MVILYCLLCLGIVWNYVVLLELYVVVLRVFRVGVTVVEGLAGGVVEGLSGGVVEGLEAVYILEGIMCLATEGLLSVLILIGQISQRKFIIPSPLDIQIIRQMLRRRLMRIMSPQLIQLILKRPPSPPQRFGLNNLPRSLKLNK